MVRTFVAMSFHTWLNTCTSRPPSGSILYVHKWNSGAQRWCHIPQIKEIHSHTHFQRYLKNPSLGEHSEWDDKGMGGSERGNSASSMALLHTCTCTNIRSWAQIFLAGKMYWGLHPHLKYLGEAQGVGETWRNLGCSIGIIGVHHMYIDYSCLNSMQHISIVGYNCFDRLCYQ